MARTLTREEEGAPLVPVSEGQDCRQDGGQDRGASPHPGREAGQRFPKVVALAFLTALLVVLAVVLGRRGAAETQRATFGGSLRSFVQQVATLTSNDESAGNPADEAPARLRPDQLFQADADPRSGVAADAAEADEAKCLRTDRSYQPMDMVGQIPSVETCALACRTRCALVPGCGFFMYHSATRICHIQDQQAVEGLPVAGFVAASRECLSDEAVGQDLSPGLRDALLKVMGQNNPETKPQSDAPLRNAIGQISPDSTNDTSKAISSLLDASQGWEKIDGWVAPSAMQQSEFWNLGADADSSALAAVIVARTAEARHAEVDTDRDGNVTMAELKVGFAGDLANVSLPPNVEKQLRSMMEQCDTTRDGRCTLEELRQQFLAWLSGATESRDLRGDLFGPGNLTRGCANCTTGQSRVRCGTGRRRCYKELLLWEGRPLLAWLRQSVAALGACACDADADVKRLTQLAMCGVLAAESSDLRASPLGAARPNLPQCGRWDSASLVKEVHFTLPLTRPTSRFVNSLLYTAEWGIPVDKFLVPVTSAWFANIEAVVYKTQSHDVQGTGSEDRKVCMIAWTNVRSWGDWALALTTDSVGAEPFAKGITTAGLKAAYSHVRGSLISTVMRDCCETGSPRPAIVVTGWGWGGSLAQLNAMDMVRNWQCGNGPISSADISLITFGAYGGLTPRRWSWGEVRDDAVELAGRAVEVRTENDHFDHGRPILGNTYGSGELVTLSCKGLPQVLYNGLEDYYAVGNPTTFGSRDTSYNCHGLPAYQSALRDFLIYEGWGSTCNGQCGNPNYQLWQRVLLSTGDVPSRPGFVPTACGPSPAGQPCNCAFDDCWQMTRRGVCVP